MHRFLAVVGTSGSGKSSLVRAGLLPALHGGTMAKAGSSWEVVVMKPGGSPIENLAHALIEADFYDGEDAEAQLRLEATLTRSRQGLVEAIKQSDADPAANVLLVVDQFEEIFRFRQQGISAQEAAGAFVDLLLQASNQADRNIFIALTMRSDYLGDCAQIPGLAEAVNDGEYLIPRLGRQQRRDAIEKPVHVGGAAIAERLVQRLLNDVGDDADQLPVLQHALMRTWDVWAEDHQDEEPIDLRHYEMAGGMESSLSLHADSVFDSLPDEAHRQAATKLFKTLTERTADNREIRRPRKLADLIAIVGDDPATVRTVIDAYRQPGVTFLMPTSEIEIADETVIDISHESLMRVWENLRQWVDEEAQSARIYHRLLDTAQLWQQSKAGLYHDPDLSIAQSWREENHPNAAWAELYGGGFETASEFLDTSHEEAARVERQREERRQRELAQAKALADSQARTATLLKRFAVTVGAAAVIAIGLAAWAMRESREAKDQRTRAEEKTLEAEEAKVVAEEAAEEARYAQGRTWLANAHVLSEAKDVLGARLKASRALGFSRAGREILTAAQQEAFPVLLKDDRPGWQDALDIVTESAGLDLLWQNGALPQHSGLINSMDASPDGRYLATTSEGERVVRVWDTATGDLLKVLEVTASDNEVVGFSRPDGRYLALAGDDEIEFWEVEDGAFSRVRDTAIKAEQPDQDLSMAEGEEGGTAANIARPNFRCMAFSPDGTTLALGDDNGRLYVWKNWRSFENLPGGPSIDGLHRARIVDLEYRPGKGDLLASVAREGPTVKLVDASTFKLVEELTVEPFTRGSQGPQFQSVSFSADGMYLAAAGHHLPVTVWEVDSRQAAATLLEDEWKRLTAETVDGARPEELGFRGHGLSFSKKGARLAVGWGQTGSDDDPEWYEPTVTLFDLAADPDLPDRIRDIPVPNGFAGLLAFSHDDQHLAIAQNSGQSTRTQGQGGFNRIWLREVESGQHVSYQGRSHSVMIAALEFSPDGTLFASADREGTIRIWEARSGNLRHTIAAHQGRIDAIRFSANGERLFSIGHQDQKLCAWNTKTGTEAQAPVSIPHRLVGLDLNPNGESLVVGGWSRDFQFYDPETLELRKTFTAAHGGAMRITPDGKQAVVYRNTSEDPEMVIYDLATDSKAPPQQIELWSEDEEAASVNEVVFSPNGLTMVVSFANGVVKTWDRRPDRSRQSSHFLVMPDGASNAHVTFDHAGRLLTGDSSGKVRIWDLSPAGGPELLHVLDGGDRVTALATSPNGQLVVTGSGQGMLHMWAISNDEKVVAQIDGLGMEEGPGVILKGAFSIALARERRLLFTPSPGDGDHPNAVMAWSIGGGRFTQAFLLEGHENPPGRLVLSPDERYLASGEFPVTGDPAPLLLWDLETKESRVLTRCLFPNFVFSPDGATLAGQTWWGPNRARIGPTPLLFWDVEKGGDPVAESRDVFHDDVFGLSFTPDGKQLVVGDSGDGQPLRIYDFDPVTREIKLAHTIAGNTGRLTEVAFSPNGSFFVSASSHGAHTQLWDFASRTPRGPASRVELQDWAWSSTISPDGSLVAVGGGNSKVVVARTDGSGEIVGRYQGTEGWLKIASDLAFDSDNRTLFMGFSDGRVVSWRIPSAGTAVEPARLLDLVSLDEPSGDLQWDFRSRWLGPPDQSQSFCEIGNLYLPGLKGEPSPREAQLALFEYYLSEELFAAAHAVLLAMDPEEASECWSQLSLAITSFLVRNEAEGESNESGAIWHLAQSIFENHPPGLEVQIMLLFRNKDWERLVEILRDRLPAVPADERAQQMNKVVQLLEDAIEPVLARTDVLAENDPAIPSRILLLTAALIRAVSGFEEAWKANPWQADAALQEGSPATELLDRLAQAASDILVPERGEWKYFDELGAPDPIWNQPGYDDRAWGMGNAPFGFTEDAAQAALLGTELRREVRTKVTVAAEQAPQLVYYFRKEFETPVDWDSSLQQLTASFLCDDGLALYLDGEELLRYNLPDDGDLGPETVALQTIGGENEETRVERVVPARLLQPGKHLLAAQVHQATTDSSDLIFDLALFTPSENTWRSPDSLEAAVSFLSSLDPEQEALPWLDAFTPEAAADSPNASFYTALHARLLAALGAPQEALAIADRRLASLQDSYDPVLVGERKRWLRWKEETLRQFGFPRAQVEAVAEAFKAIPPRNPDLDAKRINLDDYFTRSFYQDVDLSVVPETFQPLREISYDLRGIVELNSGPLPDGKTVEEHRGYPVPDRVEGIALGQKTEALHFLLNAFWAREPEPLEVARFILHYEDGTTAERPLVYGEDLEDWIEGRGGRHLPDAKLGWKSPHTDRRMTLAELTWKHPHPEKAIASIDFVSSLRKAGPFLAAITLE